MKGCIKMASTGKRLYQRRIWYRFDEGARKGTVDTSLRNEASSFATIEKAVEHTEYLISRADKWIDFTIERATIVNKETKEVVWSYGA